MSVNPKNPNYETIINQTDNGASRCVKASHLRYPQCASRDNTRAKEPPVPNRPLICTLEEKCGKSL